MCSNCKGTGLIAVPDSYGAGMTAVRCAACDGSGRAPAPPNTVAGMTRRERADQHATSSQIESLLLRIPHDSDASWRAFVYLQTYHSAGMRIALLPSSVEEKRAALEAERGALVVKLLALLGEGGGK